MNAAGQRRAAPWHRRRYPGAFLGRTVSKAPPGHVLMFRQMGGSHLYSSFWRQGTCSMQSPSDRNHRRRSARQAAPRRHAGRRHRAFPYGFSRQPVIPASWVSIYWATAILTGVGRSLRAGPQLSPARRATGRGPLLTHGQKRSTTRWPASFLGCSGRPVLSGLSVADFQYGSLALLWK